MVAFPLIVLFVWISKFILVKGSSEVFNQCIRSSPTPSIMKCIGQQTLSSLQSIDKVDNYTITSGLEMIRSDDGKQRSFAEFFVEDPTDFRGLLENAGTIVGQRSLQWDLGIIQPGLCLRVGPTVDSNSILEFVMDPNKDRGDKYLMEEPSTARILTRQFVVPFLLGIKFNLMTILPLLFAGIILLLKKAVFLGKFAMFITGLLGVGGILQAGQFSGINSFQQPNRPFGFGGFGGGGGSGGGLGGLGSGLGGLGGNNQFGTFGDSSLSGGYYKSSPGANIGIHEFATTEKDPQFIDQFYNYEKKLLQNKSDKSLDEEPKLSTERTARANTYRNFVWQAS